MYSNVVFKWNEKFNLLITRKTSDGRQIVSAHYILPDSWTEDDCYDYGDAIVDTVTHEAPGSFPIEHRIVG